MPARSECPARRRRPLLAWRSRRESRGRVHRSGETLKRLALSHDALLADLSWIRAVQSFGRARLDGGADKSYEQLYALLDITTTLDPQFNIAYRVGAIFLAEPRPNGAGTLRRQLRC